jgi:hypothetical protein
MFTVELTENELGTLIDLVSGEYAAQKDSPTKDIFHIIALQGIQDLLNSAEWKEHPVEPDYYDEPPEDDHLIWEHFYNLEHEVNQLKLKLHNIENMLLDDLK